MGTPITWRNVNLPTSQAPAALSAAISAFGSAEAGAQGIVERARETARLGREQKTRDFLGSAMADGQITGDDFADVPAGVNTEVLLDAFNLDREGRDTSALRGAQTRNTNALAENQEFLNTEPQQTLRTEDTQSQIAARAANTALRQQEFDLAMAERKDRLKKGESIEGANTFFNRDIMGQATAMADEFITEEEAAYREQYADQPEVLSEKLAALKAGRENFIQDSLDEIFPESWREMRTKYPSLSYDDLIKYTDMGYIQGRADKISDEVSAKFAEIDEQRRRNASKAASGTGNLAYLGGSIANPRIVDDPQANTLDQADALDTVNILTGEEIDDEDDIRAVNQVRNAVGKSRMAFEHLLDRNEYPGHFGFGGSIKWDKVATSARQLASDLNKKAENIAKPASPGQRPATREAARQARQQAFRETASAPAPSPEASAEKQVKKTPAEVAQELAALDQPENQEAGIQILQNNVRGIRKAFDDISDTVKNKNAPLVRQYESVMDVLVTGKQVDPRPPAFGTGGGVGILQGTERPVNTRERKQAAVTAQQILQQLLGAQAEENELQADQALNRRISESLEQ